jgi:hypothetical protein
MFIYFLMSSQSRRINCTYCLGEGHRINRCQDQSIALLHEGIEEVAAIDNKVEINSAFLRHYLLVLSLAELKVIGYKLNVQKVGKMSTDDIISILTDKYLLNVTRHAYLIDNMNLNELDYFAEKVYKVYQYTIFDKSDETIELDTMTLDTIRHKLYNKHPANKDYNVLIKLDDEDEEMVEDNCPLCLEIIDPQNLIRTNCNHHYCDNCTLNHIRNTQNSLSDVLLCPLCRSNINLITVFNSNVCDRVIKKTMFAELIDEDCTMYIHHLPINIDLNSILYINNGLDILASLVYAYIGINIVLYLWNAVDNNETLLLL